MDEDIKFATTEEKAMFEEEKKAQAENDRAEERRRKLALKKKKQIQESKSEREAKAKQLDDLLMNCAKFSDILTKKTEVLGRVGSGFDGKALGEHDLVMAKQPKCMIGGTMRDYQLEGLTWMYLGGRDGSWKDDSDDLTDCQAAGRIRLYGASFDSGTS
jgi:ATP-dependent DNA helicase